MGATVIRTVSEVYAKDYGVRADGVTDDAAAIQAALDFAATNLRAVVVLPHGTMMISAKLYVPNKVMLRGAGEFRTTIKAHASFPSSTAMVEVGAAADSFAFGAGCEALTIDCNSKAGSIGIFSTKMQEDASIRNVVVTNYMQYGLRFETPAENFTIEDVYILASTSATTCDGIYLYVIPWCSIHRATIDPNSGAKTGYGINMNASRAVMWCVHVEQHSRGIIFDNTSTGAAFDVSGSNMTYLVEISASAGAAITLVSLKKGASVTAALNDNLNSKVVTADIAMYNVGDLHVSGGKVLAKSGIGVGNSAAATTPGAVTKKIQVFDETGASLGFLAVYGAIT
jgi:hypothetical protein